MFIDEEELNQFRKKHSKEKIRKVQLSGYKGKCFLGIDAGSTTIKVVLMGENHEILYTYYDSNEGHPLKKVVDIVNDLYNL